MTNVEIWKDIPNYEGLYQVSNFGNVKSIERRTLTKAGWSFRVNEIILNKGKSLAYENVTLSKNSKTKTIRVHRLVADAFIPNTENRPQVNHIDGNGSNNHYSNLEWSTSSQNIQHSYDKLGRQSPNKGKSGVKMYNSKRVFCTTLGRYWESANLAELELGISSGKVTAVCRGERNHTKNLHFNFV